MMIFGCVSPYISSNDGCCMDFNLDDVCDESDDAFTCGDAVCSNSETALTCCLDCGCGDAQICADNECKELTEQNNYSKFILQLPELKMWQCGDGVCDADNNEDKANCCKDCGCNTGVCGDNGCQNLTLFMRPLEMQSDFFTGRSYTEYIVVVLKDFGIAKETEKHETCTVPNMYCTSNNYAEFMFYSEASIGNDVKQSLKWPLGGYYKTWDYRNENDANPVYIFLNAPIFSRNGF